MTDTPDLPRHPTELPATEAEIVLMNEAGRAAMDALYVLLQRDRLGSMCAFVSIAQMALARSKLSGPEALACMSNVLAHNFGDRYRIVVLPPDEGGDQPEPPMAVH